MPTVYQTPGVYFERTDNNFNLIPGVRTDIAGFIGIAESGPGNVPLPVESFRQFEAYFGGFIGAGYLAYAVRSFFDNGGTRCWIVRVVSDATTAAQAELRILPLAGASPTWLRIEAISEGVWGDELEITLQETHRAQTKTIPSPGVGSEAVVEITAGLAPRVLTRLRQSGTEMYAVIRSVDAENSRVIWEESLSAFDSTKTIFVESVEYTLLVRRAGRLMRIYEELSLVPGHPRFGPDVLPTLRASFETKRLRILPSAPEPVAIIGPEVLNPGSPIRPLDLSAFQNRGGGQASQVLRGGADGLSTLRPFDFMGEEPAIQDSNDTRSYKLRGIAALNTIDEVAIAAVPDIHIRPRPPRPLAPLAPCVPDPCLPISMQIPAARPPRTVGDLPPTFSDEVVLAVQRHLVEQCELLRDRLAILDAPYSAARNDKLGTAAIRRWRNLFDSTYAALYYPWLKVTDPIRVEGIVREVPPSGHVAGLMARSDREIGVHKAPANVELVWAEDVTAEVSDAEHGLLNQSGINALRVFPGRGIRVFGARTVSSDPDWRFVNVRRLLMMIEESVDEGLQWVVFEPNDHVTRTRVTLALRTFLTSIWQRGGLMGPTSDDAFFVKCTADNNPPSERGNGRLLAEIGVAASQPFEFLVVRVGRINNALEIDEVGAIRGGR